MAFFIDLSLYLLGLPFSVWMLANFFALIDRRPISGALIRIVVCLTLITLILLLTHRAYLHPILYSFATVVALHALSGWYFRHSLGTQSYQSVPNSFKRFAEPADTEDIEIADQEPAIAADGEEEEPG